jgi:exonuclease-1
MKLSHTTVAVDGFVWLHQSAHSCRGALAAGAPTAAYLRGIASKLSMLRSFGIQVIFVLDGEDLPAKEGEKASRAAARAKGQGGVSVTPEMAAAAAGVCRHLGVEVVRAPREADPQLAWLSRAGLVDAVITVDSDLLAYAVPVVVTQLRPDGVCNIYRRAHLSRIPHAASMSAQAFRYACILSGCDFLARVYGTSPDKAFQLVSRHTEPQAFLAVLRARAGDRYPPNYEEAFWKTDLVFRHQWIFNTKTKRVEPLTPISDSFPELLGREVCPDTGGYTVPPELAEMIGLPPPRHLQEDLAAAKLHPTTHEVLLPRDPVPRLDDLQRAFVGAHHSSGPGLGKSNDSSVQTTLSAFLPSSKEGGGGKGGPVVLAPDSPVALGRSVPARRAAAASVGGETVELRSRFFRTARVPETPPQSQQSRVIGGAGGSMDEQHANGADSPSASPLARVNTFALDGTTTPVSCAAAAASSWLSHVVESDLDEDSEALVPSEDEEDEEDGDDAYDDIVETSRVAGGPDGDADADVAEIPTPSTDPSSVGKGRMSLKAGQRRSASTSQLRAAAAAARATVPRTPSSAPPSLTSSSSSSASDSMSLAAELALSSSASSSSGPSRRSRSFTAGMASSLLTPSASKRQRTPTTAHRRSSSSSTSAITSPPGADLFAAFSFTSS